MKKIMFVCHGNICRSPMAEFVMKDMLKKRGSSDNFLVRSSAVSDEEIRGGVGNPVYPPARRELARHGVDCAGKRAVKLTRGDYSAYDLFVAMDNSNVRRMIDIFGSDPENKVRLLSDFGGCGEVSDPWYTGDFSAAYRDIVAGVTALLQQLGE